MTYMALEAVVFHDLSSCNAKDMYTHWEISGLINEDKSPPNLYSNWEASCSSYTGQGFEEWDIINSSTQQLDLGATAAPMAATSPMEDKAQEAAASSASNGRKKRRRRTKSSKNKEDLENQRMTHITVERNRRKQMNNYLALLRSLMPPSYAQRGDQASIVAGAINYVKELEQLLQFLEVRKQLKQEEKDLTPLASFFSFPQYSSTNTAAAAAAAGGDAVPANPSAVADIEVTIVESHANLKVLCRRRPKQLLKLVVGLQNLRLFALHLNVTTFEVMVLYTFSLKVEEDCQLTTVDEIASAVHQIVGRIHEEDGFYSSS